MKKLLPNTFSPKLFLPLILLMIGFGAYAQPTNMSVNQDVSGTYANTAMTLKGGAYQARFQEGTGQATGTRNWQFNSDSYTNSWCARAAATLAAYNTTIVPNIATASGNWAVSGLNSLGKLPVTQTGFYYTYNLAKGTTYASQLMGVLETNYNPVNISAVTNVVGSGMSQLVTITTSATPAAGENIMVRYSTSSTFATSIIVQATGSATTWTANIPYQNAQVYFYVYTTPKTVATINAEVAVSAQGVHDVSMLNFFNNAGTNYTYTPQAGNVLVQATGGTTGPTAYTTVKGAFDAINLGTHLGVIQISITANTTEAVAAVLNSSGQGSANYTSVVMRPVNDGLIVNGTSVLGRGLIELNGADNVTIDGDNPNTAGTNRNLTFSFTSSTLAYVSVIRIATGTAAPFLDNNNIVIRNAIVLGNVTSGNAATITSTTGSSNTTFGILAGAGGGATPTAIAGVATAMNTSATVNSLIIDNCSINQCARGIVFSGNSATSSSSVAITNNLIGDQVNTISGVPPYTTPATTVYTKGIYIAGVTSLSITGNILKNIVSYVGTTMNGIELVSAVGTTGGTLNINNNTINGVTNNVAAATNGILMSSATIPYNCNLNIISNIRTVGNVQANGLNMSSSGTSGVINGNKISTIYAHSTVGSGARGILLASGSAITVSNNMIWDLNAVNNNSTVTAGFGIKGIYVSAGTGNKIYHNTVNLAGTMLGASTGPDLNSCLLIVGTGQTTNEIRNNIFSNTMITNAAVANVCITLPASGTSSMGLIMNNNAMYTSTGANYYMGSQLTTFVGYTAANFSATATTPATNFRSYTSTLSAAGTNDNASFAATTAAPFVSATDLHIPAGAAGTALESAGATGLAATDIDGDVRPGPTGSVNGGALAPDMGADEFDGVPAGACLTPTAQPTAYVAGSVTSTTAAATFTASSGGASGYLVISSPATFSGTVVDGTTYANSATIGNGTVIANTTTASFSATGLVSNTSYIITIIAFNNTSCIGGPKYRTTTPLTSTFTTCPLAATAAVNSGIAQTTATVSWTAAAVGGSALPITYVLSVFSDAARTTLVGSAYSTGAAVTQNITGLSPAVQYWYSIVASTTSCAAATPLTGTFTTLCQPASLVTTPNTRCGTGTVVLTGAPSAGTTAWYAAATGGIPLFTGNSFTTPSISANTTYFAESQVAGVIASGGRLATAGTTAYNDGTTGLVFDVTTAFTLNSVSVYNTAAGTLIISLVNSSGTVLQTSSSFSVPFVNTSTAYVANLGWSIPLGTGYRLICATGSTGSVFIRESGLGGFPYSLSTFGSITGGYFGGASTTYYQFYNWNMSTVCASSPRNSVTATVTPATTVNITGTSTICAGSGTSLTAVSANDPNYAYTWSPATGLSATTGANITATPATTTTYTVNALDSVSGCAASTSITIVVSSVPVAPTTTNLSICTGSTIPASSGLTSTSVGAPLLTGSQTLNFTVSAQPTETNVAPGNVVASASLAALPAGAILTSTFYTYNGLTALGTSWRSDINLGLSGAITDPALPGVGAPGSAGTFNYVGTTISGFSLNALTGTVNLLYWDSSNDNAGAAEATFPTGTNVASVVVNYSYPNPAAVSWFTTLTGGSSIGSGTPFNPIGNDPALPNSSTAGTYSYYAQVNNGICGSVRTKADLIIGAPFSTTASTNQSTTCAGTAVTLDNTPLGGVAPYTYSWSNGTSVVGLTKILSVSQTTTTTYTVTATDVCGTTTTSSVVINVNALPILTIATPTATCSPDTVDITSAAVQTANNGTSTAYYTTFALANAGGAGNLATPTAIATSGTFFIRSNAATGCYAIQSVVVTINPAPLTPTLLPLAAASCPGIITSLVATSTLAATATVGIQTTTSATTNTPYRQSTASANQTRLQILYTAVELNAVGIIGAQNITSLGFTVTTVGSGSMPAYTISMASTNATALVTGYLAPTFTTVYTGTNILPVAGLNTYTFTTPFAWDGTSNVLVNICHTSTGGTTSSVVACSTTTPNMLSAQAGTTLCTSGNGTVTTTRPITTFGYNTQYPITWSPTAGLFTDAAATVNYTGTALTTVYAKPSSTTTYTATATLGSCTKSASTTITIKPNTTIATQPIATQTACVGTAVSFSVIGANSSTYTYQWYKDGTLLGTATAATLTIASVLASDAGSYTVNVIGECSSVLSTASVLTVNPSAVAGTATGGQTVCANRVPSDLSVSGFTGTVNKWQKSSNAAFTTPIDISGSNNAILSGATLGLVSVTTYYRAVISNTTCGDVTSNIVSVSITTTTYDSAGNWTNGLPDGNMTIVFDKDFTMASNLSGCSCTVNTGKTLTVNPNIFLILKNEINSTGTTIFENSASLIQTDSNIPNTGNISYKRNAFVKQLDYVYWSAPVAGISANSIYPGTAVANTLTWLTTAANTNGSTGNWQGTAETMAAAKGYAIRVPNTLDPTTPSTITTTFVGVPNNGNYTIGIERGGYTGIDITSPNGATVTANDDNWNLIGNPYPSAIDALDFLTANNAIIQGSVDVWTHGTTPGTGQAQPFYGTFGSNYNANDYITFNATGPNSGPTGFNGKIAAGQAFFVKMIDGAAATGSVLFSNTMRSIAHDNSQFYKSANSNLDAPKNRIWLDLVNATTNETTRTLVGYVAGATNLRDNLYDATTDYQSNQSFFSLIGQNIYSIQGRALPFANSDTILMGFAVPTAGTYKIGIHALDGLFANNGQTIYLQDNLTGLVHNLSVSPFTFVATTGANKTRFVLRYTAGALANNNNDLAANNLVIWKDKTTIKAQSVSEFIASIAIFDVLGRNVFAQNNINANSFETANVVSQQQALIVKVTLTNGAIVTKKIIF